MNLLNFYFSFIIIYQNRNFLILFMPYQTKIKSHIDGFYHPMAFQEGFEPPTDSLEGILLIFNTIGFKDLNHVFTKILIFLFSKPFHF